MAVCSKVYRYRNVLTLLAGVSFGNRQRLPVEDLEVACSYHSLVSVITGVLFSDPALSGDTARECLWAKPERGTDSELRGG